MAQHPSGFPHLLCALDACLATSKEIVIVGDPQDAQARDLLREVFHAYLPNKAVACGKEGDTFLLQNKPQINGRATAYVCENFTCGLPVISPRDLGDRLRSV
jgi:uncharacterized protein YyaL (SSP411 family)